jgi:hypothetical protein
MPAMIAELSGAAGLFGVTLLIGLLVLITSEAPLVAVAREAARSVTGSFWIGVVVQFAAVPLLLLLLLACALTIIGILLMPLVALAWALAVIGALTLGGLGVALMLGRALIGRGGGSERAAGVRGLTVGLSLVSLLWLGAAMASPIPIAGFLARLAVASVSWALLTVGLGAVVRSRIGFSALNIRVGGFGPSTWRPADTAPRAVEVQPASWATPTPLPGVVATVKRSTEPRADRPSA